MSKSLNLTSFFFSSEFIDKVIIFSIHFM